MTIDFYDREGISGNRGTFVRLTLYDINLIGTATRLAIDSGLAPAELAAAAVTDTLCRRWIRRGAKEMIECAK